jgi:hypothetical protein
MLEDILLLKIPVGLNFGRHLNGSDCCPRLLDVPLINAALD